MTLRQLWGRLLTFESEVAGPTASRFISVVQPVVERSLKPPLVQTCADGSY